MIGPTLATLDQVRRFPPVLALVDDDAAVRHALSFAFETAGISVATFSDGESALAASGQRTWRCLVLDERLPGVSGLNLLHQLRAAGVTAPCFLITSHPSQDTRRRAVAAGIEIIEKPLLDNQLLTKVRIVLGEPPR